MLVPTKLENSLWTSPEGKENIYFSKKDVNNHITKVNKGLVGADVNAILDFFRLIQQTDSEFFFEMKLDEDNVAKNIFWIDDRSRRTYQEFGDVIIFIQPTIPTSIECILLHLLVSTITKNWYTSVVP